MVKLRPLAWTDELIAVCAPDLVIKHPQKTFDCRISTNPQSRDPGNAQTDKRVGTYVFPAKQAYDCLTSVPFNPAVATRFLQYYNETLQFQSTLAYLKNPPTSYQQPPVDLLAGLEYIQREINANIYHNQYDFEVVLQNLVYSAHDAHLSLVSGILAAFSFGAPYGISSVSLDGIQIPKIYMTDDLVSTQEDSATFKPSPVVTINGQNVADYLTQFAAINAFGYVEPHADWNSLMYSPALDIQGYYSTFVGSANSYPGETITYVLENGTRIGPKNFIAVYNSPGPTGALETGGDFYNFFVLGFYPASFNSEPAGTDYSSSMATATSIIASETSSSVTTPTPSGWTITPYPQEADVMQPNLAVNGSVYGGGFITGYFLNDTSTAVLSIPSFREYGDAIGAFSDTVGQFLRRSQEAGLKHVVVDLQQNSGGDTFLAFDTFQQFFPGVIPFAGSRMRAHANADILGNTFTNYWDSLSTEDYDYYGLLDDEWVASDRLDAATGANYTSWGEFYGPFMYNGDYFTTTQRYNLSNQEFDQAALAGYILQGLGGFLVGTTPPYTADNIILLTDGLCSSACALFLEMMHHEVGVRTVVAGGRPSHGPMQAASGSRGARSYSTNVLDTDIFIAKEVNATTSDSLPDRAEDVLITYASVNLRDQIRRGENVPLQFVYDAADCRIFYTPETVLNLTNLWNYAANAIWANQALCVQGSTGYATTGTTTDTSGPPPVSVANGTTILHNTTDIVRIGGVTVGFNASFNSQLPDTQYLLPGPGQRCQKQGKAGCQGYYTCELTPSCGNNPQQLLCLQLCSPSNNYCPCVRYPVVTQSQSGYIYWEGYCQPSMPNCAATGGKAVSQKGAGSPNIN